MVHFFVSRGLVDAGLVAQFGPVFWAVTAVALAAQGAMIWLVLHLNRRHFGTPKAAQAMPAE